MSGLVVCSGCRSEYPKVEHRCSYCGSRGRKRNPGTIIMVVGAIFMTCCLITPVFIH